MINLIEHQKCTGCKMCHDICPVSAISFSDDDKGFWYPTVDYSLCVKCGNCVNKCPSLSGYCKDNSKEIKVYSAFSNDDNVRLSSTSGGVFWEVASRFINSGGVVAGCRYSEDWKSCRHALATNLEELELLKGSKYFQSDTEGIYSEVKRLLLEGKRLLFCGTPCQNAALLSFLGTEPENLFTIDFICRNVNSPKAFRAYIDELENEQASRVLKVQLKNKDSGWQSLASKVFFENGSVSLRDRTADYWVRGFIENDLYNRESCFECRYRTMPRISADITIGDFWGIRNQSSEDMFKGISVVIINSEKGEGLFNQSCDNLIVNPHDISDVIPGNPALLKNPEKNHKEDRFFDMINSGERFSSAVNKCIKLSVWQRMKNKVKCLFSKLHNAKYLFVDKSISLPLFIYYNFLSRHVERHGKSKILPHTNTIINFAKGSKIILSGQDLEIGYNKLKGSKAETRIRLDKNSKWICKNGGLLFYNTELEIKENARFESGFFSANGGSVIIAHKSITFGEDVMIGRNVIIYDSDFHSLYNRKHLPCNPPKPVVIEDHVWLTTNVMVQKGVRIGRDSLIAAYTVVNKDVPAKSIVGGRSNAEIIKDWVSWDRNCCPFE